MYQGPTHPCLTCAWPGWWFARCCCVPWWRGLPGWRSALCLPLGIGSRRLLAWWAFGCAGGSGSHRTAAGRAFWRCVKKPQSPMAPSARVLPAGRVHGRVFRPEGRVCCSSQRGRARRAGGPPGLQLPGWRITASEVLAATGIVPFKFSPC